MPSLHFLRAATRCRATQRISFPSLARRVAAIAILSACALEAHAHCLAYVASFTTVTALGGAGYAYEGGGRTVQTCNYPSDENIAEFYMPYFSDMSISNISQSAGWTHDVEAANDLFHVGGGVVHFALATPGAYAPFTYSFNASFAPIASASLVVAVSSYGKSISTLIPSGIQWNAGQEFLMPGSPDTVAGFASPVPEPSSAAMLAAGLALVGFTTSRRKRGAQSQAQSR